MGASFNINSNAVVAHTARLERLSKTAMPNVVRKTLNEAALDVKKVTMPSETKNTFEKRKPNFFKSHSKVVFAKGSDLNTMRSMVGFDGNDQAVEDLEQQEKGGTIKGRSFIAMKEARVGKSDKKSVRANARLKGLKIIDPKNVSGANKGQRFIKSAYHAGRGGLVLGDNYVFRVNSLRRNERGGLKLTALYSFEKGRSVNVKATNFMEKSSEKTAKKMEKFFSEEAEKRIKREFR